MDGSAAVPFGRTPTPSPYPERKTDFLPQPSHSLAARAAAERRNDFVSLWKRGNVYWSYLFVDGIRYSQSTGTNNRRQALVVEQHFREELNLQRHQIVQPSPQMPFGELAARFLAEGNARRWHTERLKLLLPYWGNVPIGRIHKAMADDYR